MAGSSKAFEMQRLPSEAAGVADSFVPGEGNDAVALDEVSESIYVSYNNRGDTIQGNPLLAFNKKKDMSNVRAKLKFIFPALAIGMFLSAGDQTIIVSSYGRIGSDLNELEKTSWLATAYLCTTTASQPLYGKLADIFGRKACLLFAYSIFGLGALLCGLAQDMNQLTIARALTGVGAGGITTVSSILLSDIVSLEERGIWQGYVNMVFASGSGLGAPIGGILTNAIGWRWPFIAQVPLFAIAIFLVVLLLKLPPIECHGNQQSRLASVDFLGAATLTTCLVLLLIFMDNVSSDSDRWTTYLWLIGSMTFFLVFLWIETRIAADPLTPLRLFFGRDFLGANLALAVGNVAWYALFFYLPLLYQAVGHFSASTAGALLLPAITSAVLGGLAGGALLKRKGATGFSTLAVSSYTLVAVACAGVALGSVDFAKQTSMAMIAVLSISLFIGGFGNGAGMTATLVVVVVVASPEDQAVVTACIHRYRQLGNTIGLAMISLVFRRVLTVGLEQRLTEALVSSLDANGALQRVQESLEYLDELPIDARAEVEVAYGDACRAVFLFSAGLAVCAIISAFMIQEKRNPNMSRARRRSIEPR